MHLGPADYRVLLALRDGGPRPARGLGEELRLEEGTVLSRAAVAYLEAERLVEVTGGEREHGAGGNAIDLRLTADGASALERELGRSWMFDRAGQHAAPPRYWFECPDPVTGCRFVVDIHAEDEHHRAAQLFLMVGRCEEARMAARAIDETGEDNGIDWEVDGMTVWIWRAS